MIDFSTLQGLTIPEGVVTQIADASGRALWSAVKAVTVTITNTITATNDATYAKVTINGVVYDGSETLTLELPVGTEIECYANTNSTNFTNCYIRLNGTKLSGTPPITYKYVVSKNVTLEVRTIVVMRYTYGSVDIIET